MSDTFDELTAGLFEDVLPMDTHDGIHFYGAMRQLIQGLGAWEVEDAAAEANAKLREFLAPGAAERIERQMDDRAATLRWADDMIEVGRFLGTRLNEWVTAKGYGPLYLYAIMPCCGEVRPVVLGDGKPARFFDPELDETPVRPID